MGRCTIGKVGWCTVVIGRRISTTTEVSCISIVMCRGVG